MDGKRRLRRYFPELDAEGTQDLPLEDLPRYAFKMATGSGKTWVMAMAVVWFHFHKKRVPDSPLSTNFLILAPNVIVYRRLEKDFGSNKIFYDLPLIPPEWRGAWSQKVILRGESTEPDPSGNLFLTNIQQVYESRDKEWTPQNAVDALLGRKPVKDLASYQRSMLERLKDLKNLVVMNDEAHHVHDEELKWSQSLLTLHTALPKGLALWLDFSATPKDQNGTYYPWTICDYPLAQGVEDRIMKAPLIVTKEDDPKPVLTHNVKKLSLLDPTTFAAIYGLPDLEEIFRVTLKMEFVTTETEIHQEDLAAGAAPMAQELLSAITDKVIQKAKLTNAFAKLYPIVRCYIVTRCFGKAIDVDDETIRSHLRRFELQEGIARYLARKIGELTVEKRALEFENAGFKLSDTKAFSWRRNLPPLEATRTLFNYVATYNDFERRFAEFLDKKASDVLRFASLGTTEQGESGTQFKVDYLKPSGAIGFYHPDWVVVQKTAAGEVHWIIETKGRVWEGTEAKDAAIRDWCQRITEQTGRRWEFARVNQSTFQASKPVTLDEAVRLY